MRQELSALDGERRWFAAIYAGTTDAEAIAATLKQPPAEPIALLQSVFLGSEMITDHLWSSWAQQFRSFPPGAKLEFLGTVKAYPKKYEWDYGVEEIAWVQPVGQRKPIIKRPCPTSQKEANYLLTLITFAYKKVSVQRG